MGLSLLWGRRIAERKLGFGLVFCRGSCVIFSETVADPGHNLLTEIQKINCDPDYEGDRYKQIDQHGCPPDLVSDVASKRHAHSVSCQMHIREGKKVPIEHVPDSSAP